MEWKASTGSLWATFASPVHFSRTADSRGITRVGEQVNHEKAAPRETPRGCVLEATGPTEGGEVSAPPG